MCIAVEYMNTNPIGRDGADNEKIIDRLQDTYEEQELWMTRLDWVGIQLNQFEMFEEHENCLSRWNYFCSSWKQCLIKTM